ncbi:MAG: c-type cytochrome [Pirellulales bacterium]|nr:c-type cytochrome [Pirellulales bacterium]
MKNASHLTTVLGLNSRVTLALSIVLTLGVICLVLSQVGAEEPKLTQSGNTQMAQQPPPKQQKKPPQKKKQPPPKPLDMIKLEASFDEKLFPIFEEQCANCHDVGEAERGLQLLEFSTFLVGSINGPIIEPGKAEKSKLFQVLQEGSDPHMPPDEQLSDEDLSTIKSWIDGLPKALKSKLGKHDKDGGTPHLH